MNGTTYINAAIEIVKKAWYEQEEQIDHTTTVLKEAIAGGKSIFVFGCGHAGMIAEEVFSRAGGLAVINPIFYPGFMTNTRPITLTSVLERMEGVGKMILDGSSIKSGDILILHSVSGRNTASIEMAIEAKQRNITVICLTSVQYSSLVKSRHPSGKRLFEVCDIVIDNKCVPGDAVVKLDGLEEAIGPTSTISGAALMNGIVIETVRKLIEDGITPPVYLSANLDGGDEHNLKIYEKYKGQIHYL